MSDYINHFMQKLKSLKALNDHILNTKVRGCSLKITSVENAY